MEKTRIIVTQSYFDINPIQCGMDNCAPSHSYGPAIRSYYLLHFVVSGKGQFTTSRGTFTLVKSDMFIIRPHEITYYEADEKDPWTYIWIGFTSKIKLPTALNTEDFIYAPYLERIFLDAINTESFENGRHGYEAFLCGKIFELCALLYSGDKISSQISERYVKPAISIMESEFASGITISRIAERLHINRSYFTVIFRDAVKKTPAEYLSELRMNEAARLLRIYKYSVTVTASSVGYPDVFVFSRAFKKHFGCSPKSYARIGQG